MTSKDRKTLRLKRKLPYGIIRALGEVTQPTERSEEPPMINTIWKARKRNFLGLPWTFTVYGFSEDRLYIKTGMLNTKEDEVRLYRITDIGLTQSLWQRIMGMGTIQIYSSDQSMGDFQLVNLKHSGEVKEQLSQLIEQERENKRVSSREFIGVDGEEEDDILT